MAETVMSVRMTGFCQDEKATFNSLYVFSLGALLHDIPVELEPKMSELLYECVFESKPGSRIYAAKALKMLLGIIEKSYKH